MKLSRVHESESGQNNTESINIYQVVEKTDSGRIGAPLDDGLLHGPEGGKTDRSCRVPKGGVMRNNIAQRPSTSKRNNASWIRVHAAAIGILLIAVALASPVSAEEHLIENNYAAHDALSDVTWSWGSNERGQLGDDNGEDSAYPSPVLGEDLSNYFVDTSEIDLGYAHTLARVSGALWAWGSNEHGQLGDGSEADSNTPVEIFEDNVETIAAGHNHSLALVDGTLWAWGKNDAGQLGDGTTADRDEPVEVWPDGTFPDDIDQIAAGESHSLVLLDDESVWAWGSNEFGQLGDGTNVDRHTPVQVLSPLGSGGLDTIQQISAGSNHNLAVREITIPVSGGDDETTQVVLSWGDNTFGQLGDGTTQGRSLPDYVLDKLGFFLFEIDDVVSGGDHNFLQFNNNTFESWGRNDHGQLAIDAGGEIVTTPRTVVDDEDEAITNPAEYSAGLDHSLIRDGSIIFAAGSNAHGQLGQGHTESVEGTVVVKEPFGGEDGFEDSKQVAAGGTHSLATMELPLPGGVPAETVPVGIGNLVFWNQAEEPGPGGATHYCVVRSAISEDPLGENLQTIACLEPNPDPNHQYLYLDNGCSNACWYNVFAVNAYGPGPDSEGLPPSFNPIQDHGVGVGEVGVPDVPDLPDDPPGDLQGIVNTYCETLYNDDPNSPIPDECEEDGDGNWTWRPIGEDGPSLPE